MRPIFPERRRRPRILTLRNTATLGAILLVAFVVISIRSEMRGSRTRDYGRLMDRQIDRNIPQKPPMPVVQEAHVDDQSSPNPMLVEPLVREQWLHDANAPMPTMPAQTIPARVGDKDIVIVGGPEGVQVVRQQRRRAVLSGGFGR